MEGQEATSGNIAEIEISMLNREVASISENVTDLLRSRNNLQSRVEDLEKRLSDVIGRNCLLVSEKVLIEETAPVVMAGENESADDQA